MPKWLKRTLEFLFVTKRFVVKTKRTRDEILGKIEQIAENSPETFFWRMTRRGFWLCEMHANYSAYGMERMALAPVILARMDKKDGLTKVRVTIRPNLAAYIIYLPIHLIMNCCIITIPIARICTKTFYTRVESLYDTLENLLLEN